MSRTNSPRYPSLSLPAAIDRVRQVFDADRQNPVDRETIASHIGYRSVSGASDKAIASLVHYDLLERQGKGTMRVSDLAVDILHPEPGADTAAAVQRAAFAPSLYMDLFERFEVTPSEGALKSYLKRSGFLESAINAVTSAYLETCEYLKQSGATDLSVPSDVTGAESEPQTTNEQVMATMHASKVINTPPPSHAHNAQADILNLTGGGYASLVLPDELSANEFSDLKDWLKLMAKRAKRRIKPVESSAVEQAADKNRTDNSGYLDDPGYLGDGEG